MKETKTFFDKENCLNKGYASNNKRLQNHKSNIKKIFKDTLPPLDVINEYEELYPGTLSKLLTIAENDQKYKHEQELSAIELNNNKIKSKNNLVLCGMLLALLGALILTTVFSKTIISGLIGNIIILLVFSCFILIYRKNFQKYIPNNFQNTKFDNKKSNRK